MRTRSHIEIGRLAGLIRRSDIYPVGIVIELDLRKSIRRHFAVDIQPAVGIHTSHDRLSRLHAELVPTVLRGIEGPCHRLSGGLPCIRADSIVALLYRIAFISLMILGAVIAAVIGREYFRRICAYVILALYLYYGSAGILRKLVCIRL